MMGELLRRMSRQSRSRSGLRGLILARLGSSGLHGGRREHLCHFSRNMRIVADSILGTLAQQSLLWVQRINCRRHFNYRGKCSDSRRGYAWLSAPSSDALQPSSPPITRGVPFRPIHAGITSDNDMRIAQMSIAWDSRASSSMQTATANSRKERW